MEYKSLNDYLRSCKFFARTTSFFLIFSFFFVYYMPSALAAIDAVSTNTAIPYISGKTDEDKLSNGLQSIKENVAQTKAMVDARMQEESGITEAILNFFGLSNLQNESLSMMLGLNEQIQTLNSKVMANFADVESMIVAKKLPSKILQRHYDTVSKYQEEFSKLQLYIQNCTTADSLQDQQSAMDILDRFLKEQKFKQNQQEFDPNDLPNKVLSPSELNVPKTTRDEFIQSNLSDRPLLQFAALGKLKFDNLSGANNPAYLAESDEIVFAKTVKDRAAELNFDAVKIYHWVRNNIEWIPGWGAIQNAEMTLSTRRGNAMDIASLTISLLRVSEIPARYVHGTIEVSEERYKNWLGGFTTFEAAANFATSTGIPTTSIISGGQINKIQMEHVWVEAATDFYPSRGSNNQNADSWVQLDPSFKQYEYLKGVDALAISGINTEQLVTNLANSVTVNESEGWATGFDRAILEQAQIEIQQNLNNYPATSQPDYTLGDFTNGRKTIVNEYPLLPSALPNRIVVTGTRYDKFPSQLQQRISWGLGKDLFGNTFNPVSFPFSKVNNEKVSLSFRPATADDEATISSLLPNEEITDFSQIPGSIPSYLIKVIPELKLNGVVVKTGQKMNLGEEIDLVTNVKLVGQGRTVSPRSYSVIAGSFLVVNAYSQNISLQKLQSVQDKIDATESILKGDDITQSSLLTPEELLGDAFHAGGLGYYNQLIALSQAVASQNGNFSTLAVGMGTIGYEPYVNSFFGIPRAITVGGVIFDIPIVTSAATHDGDEEKTRQFVQNTGILSSALEHITPEQMFPSDPGQAPADAISAVKAIQKANAAGQRIYQITKSNMNLVLPNIHHDSDTMSEIRSSLNAGKEVITHTDLVSVPGWQGAGYIILDTQTGAGAYKISGGRNGGGLFGATGIVLTTLNVFYGAIAAISQTLGKKVKLLETISNFITLAKLVHSLFDRNSRCSNIQAIAFAMAVLALFVLAVVELTLRLTNPIAGFLVGVALDEGIDWLLDQTPDCVS